MKEKRLKLLYKRKTAGEEEEEEEATFIYK
jgi:hypothetical protein